MEEEIVEKKIKEINDLLSNNTPEPEASSITTTTTTSTTSVNRRRRRQMEDEPLYEFEKSRSNKSKSNRVWPPSSDMLQQRKKEKEGDSSKDNMIYCVPWCNQMFKTTKDYENHYNTMHRYGCSFCKKSLPSAHFLDLHLLETHDTLFSVMAEKKPMYICLLESCLEKFSNSQERFDHCLKVHEFPEDFKFKCLPPQPLGQPKLKQSHQNQSYNNEESMETDNTGKKKKRNNNKKKSSKTKEKEKEVQDDNMDMAMDQNQNVNAIDDDEKSQDNLIMEAEDNNDNTQNANRESEAAAGAEEKPEKIEKKPSPVPILKKSGFKEFSFGHSAAKTFIPKKIYNNNNKRDANQKETKIQLDELKNVLEAEVVPESIVM